jgi:hypothetical protein
VFDNQSLAMRENRCGHILPLKLFRDEVGFAIDFNRAMSIHFADEGNLPFSNRQIQMAPAILIVVDMEMRRQMTKRVPESIATDARISCALVFLSETSMGLFIVIIPLETVIDLPQGPQSWAMISPQDSFLPRTIETLHRGISSRFPLGDENQIEYPTCIFLSRKEAIRLKGTVSLPHCTEF